jgi:hypothetical protein
VRRFDVWSAAAGGKTPADVKKNIDTHYAAVLKIRDTLFRSVDMGRNDEDDGGNNNNNNGNKGGKEGMIEIL